MTGSRRQKVTAATASSGSLRRAAYTRPNRARTRKTRPSSAPNGPCSASNSLERAAQAVGNQRQRVAEAPTVAHQIEWLTGGILCLDPQSSFQSTEAAPDVGDHQGRGGYHRQAGRCP